MPIEDTISIYLLFLKKLKIYFWLPWVFLAACGLSLVELSSGCSLVKLHRHLIEVASLAAEHRL